MRRRLWSPRRLSDLAAVSRFFAAVDRCDWAEVQASFGGEPAATVAPADLTGAWAKLLAFFDSVHHQIGNLVVEAEGDRAEVQCHGMATHYIVDLPGGDLQFIVGTYDLSLAREKSGWKLSSMRFNFKYASGNAGLAAEAKRRVAQAAAS